MVSAERPIGAHLPLAAGMVRAADRAAEIDAVVAPATTSLTPAAPAA